ncbi:recombinase RecQ, partial [Streptomyces sp. SID11233]|nr:recombinase RecQ [Streptomyces sp. SID11233]
SLGDRVARIGQLPFLGGLVLREDDEPRRAHRGNSAQRLLSLRGALAVPAPLAEALAEHPGPVLLVDDFTDTGWTIAVAAGL